MRFTFLSIFVDSKTRAFKGILRFVDGEHFIHQMTFGLRYVSLKRTISFAVNIHSRIKVAAVGELYSVKTKIEHQTN